MYLLSSSEIPFMFTLACKKCGYSLWKNVKSGKSAIYDEDGNVVYRGTHYQANQKFLSLTAINGAKPDENST